MVTDEELVSRLHQLLSTSDLNTTTNSILRRKLEEDLGISLSDKKSFIRQQVDLYLQSHFQQQQEQEQEIQQQAQEEAEEELEDVEQEEEEIQQQEQEEEEIKQGQEEAEEQQEEEELEDVQEGSGNEKTPVFRTRSKKQKKKVKKRGGGGGGGFTKVCSLSPELQTFTGVSELARTEVVKQIWKYIREKNLQDPSDKRNIICDDALRALFDVDSVNMFKMNKALSKHIWPLESNGKEQEGEAEQADNEGSGDDKARATATKRSKKENTNVKGKGGGGGFTKVCSLSPELQKFTGVPELARTGVVKHIWSYIRENNLQDPSDRRTIICDDVLRALFNVDSINMFQMNKALAKHIWPLDSDAAASVNSTPKEKQLKHEREDPDESKRKEKRQKGSDVVTFPLSDALVKFLGTGETSLARTDVIKRIWNYIDHNNLQDPFDSGRIISDEKLKELFEVDAFDRLAVSKLLKSHFVKAEK